MHIQSTAHDPVRLHIQAHNALSMALRQLSQPGSSTLGAVGYAQKAMEALRQLAQAESVGVQA